MAKESGFNKFDIGEGRGIGATVLAIAPEACAQCRARTGKGEEIHFI